MALHYEPRRSEPATGQRGGGGGETEQEQEAEGKDHVFATLYYT